MGADFTNGRLRNDSQGLLLCAPKNIVALALFACLTAGAFAAATSTAGAARSERAYTLSVNRTSKGDRLAPAPKTSTISSPFITTIRRPPIGCDPAFSRAADPARAHIFGRCIS